MKTEGRIQQDCVRWFRNNYCLKHHDPQLIMFSIPNEGFDVFEQIRKKAIGLMKGASDTIIVFPGKVIFCEFKDGKGRQTETQKEFETKVKALGHDYWLIRNENEFKEAVLLEVNNLKK